ncbi:ABC transporter D family protein [Tieghemostelium lacteum]|uniref:ABC transporter D family protein n=1 Tax=Tieghemostelium lacteum TaxID=361077 RepID=A0A152A2X9_TIELA|nr:ABC transporter D family protein [Tieghemostelium lacteum]|eukprot:KYR00586.1 ABC transporter D family protein [Tieghemostelium lacteum]
MANRYNSINSSDEDENILININTSQDSTGYNLHEDLKEKDKKQKEFEIISKDNKLDRKFFQRFYIIIKILFSVPTIPVALVIFIFGLAVGQTYVSQFTGVLLSNVYGSFTTGDRPLFVSSIIKGFIFIGLSALFDSSIKFIVSILSWRWRKILCLAIQDQYFKNNVYYKIIAFNDKVDNPDQRITSDIDQFTSLLGTIISQCITAPMVVIYYTYLTLKSMDWYAPVIVYAYFFLGYFVNKLVMSPMVSINFFQDKLEGDFRYLHQRIRNFAEAIALQNLSKDSQSEQELVEEEKAKKHFQTLLENKRKVIFWQYGLNTASDLFTYLSPCVNYLIIAIPLFFMGTVESIPAASVTIQSYNCIMLASGFSQYINVSSSVSDLAGYISRISTMIEVCNGLESNKKVDDLSNGKEPLVHENEKIGEMTINQNSDSVHLKELSYFTPKGSLLYSNISVLIERGKDLLIMGPSGSGKSSLVKIINGLWPFFTGSIDKPSNEHLFLLPQLPYLIFGSLEEQILYPYSKSQRRIPEQDLWNLFKLLDIQYLLLREKSIKDSNQVNDMTHNWLNQLSPGEQQLISILRLIYHKPIFALLDESTSSVPQYIEKNIYNLLKSFSITAISIGHRMSLIPLHSNLLTFDEDKNWKVEAINK